MRRAGPVWVRDADLGSTEPVIPRTARPQRYRDGWRVRWTDHAGERQCKVFPKFDQAQLFLKERVAETARIVAHLQPPPPEPRLFTELCDAWIAGKAIFKRSGKDDKSMIETHLRPAFGKRPLHELGLGDVEQFRIDRASKAPKTVHNLLVLYQSMLSYAQELGWLLVIPRVYKPKLVEGEYKWLRSSGQVEKLLEAAMDETPGVMETYAVAFYTGMRAGEILGLQWSDVDFDTRLITVARSYAEPTKNGRIRYVPIMDALVQLLETWRKRCPSKTLVFPTSTGTMQLPSCRVLQETYHACLERAELPRIRFHDARHTFASHWVMRGGDIFKLQRILGHQTMQMTMRYAHLAPNAFAGDLDRLRDVVPRREEAVGVVEKGRVVPYRR